MDKNDPRNFKKQVFITHAHTNGKKVSAPVEVWIAALFCRLSEVDQAEVLSHIERMMVKNAIARPSIIQPFPNMNGG